MSVSAISRVCASCPCQARNSVKTDQATWLCAPTATDSDIASSNIDSAAPKLPCRASVTAELASPTQTLGNAPRTRFAAVSRGHVVDSKSSSHRSSITSQTRRSTDWAAVRSWSWAIWRSASRMAPAAGT
jgi:hypothetical protein